ncbi:MAG: long-chain fatty acid--CoA ligase [Alphaproteobacteria bacterium]|nr:long-chain fatty acid--CoA ligase [Alphaproteobacteria bacterium]
MAQAARTATSSPAGNAAHPFFVDGKWIWEKNYPPGVTWNAVIAPRPLPELLEHAAKEFADNIFCDFAGKAMTYAEALNTVNRIAKGLQDLGVKKGVNVGLFLPNSPHSILFHYGVLKAGGTVVNYNPLYVGRELASQAADSKTAIMVTVDTPDLRAKADGLLGKASLEKIILCPAEDGATVSEDAAHIAYDTLVQNDGAFNAPAIDAENDIAVLQYTGGTTGTPKGAMLTHANVHANVEQVCRWINDVAAPGKETIVGVLPFFHVFAMTVVMHCSIRLGKKILIHHKFDLKDVLHSLKAHKPTFFPAVPAVFNALANCPDVTPEDFASLKFCITGGAPMPADVQRLFEEKTGCKALREAYGLTEASPAVTFNPPTDKARPGSVGLPLPGTVVDIVHPETGALQPPGEKGEVCVHGPQVMKGYYNKEDETARVIEADGRLRTGDVGYIDEDGFLHLVDRLKDLIIVRGYNVYPRVVEEAIYLHPAVEECIVAGVPDDTRGETVRAWVKPAAGKTLTEGELNTFLEDKISAIERPRKIIIRDEPLPKTAVGKLSKKDLLAQEGIERKR